MKPALVLLQSLHDFGWPILAYILMAPLAVFIVPGASSREERVAKLLLVGTLVAIIELFFFIGTEGSNFVEVARFHPMWGGYTVIMMLIAIGALGKWAIHRARDDRATISLIGGENHTDSLLRAASRKSYIAAVGGWIAGLILAIIWLSRIASSQ